MTVAFSLHHHQHFYFLSFDNSHSNRSDSNRQLWPWSTKWSRAKDNRVLPRECTGHSKHPLPTTQETTLSMTITKVAAKLLQSFLILCNPIDSSPPGFSIPGIPQARILEWVAISFSNAGKWKAKLMSLSHVRQFTTPWIAAHEDPPSMGFTRQ